MERKIHIGNKWWKIMTIQYSKEMKTTKDAMKKTGKIVYSWEGTSTGE
jgi:hypothetical protein